MPDNVGVPSLCVFDSSGDHNPGKLLMVDKYFTITAQSCTPHTEQLDFPLFDLR